jgi:hypothetical protein
LGIDRGRGDLYAAQFGRDGAVLTRKCDRAKRFSAINHEIRAFRRLTTSSSEIILTDSSSWSRWTRDQSFKLSKETIFQFHFESTRLSVSSSSLSVQCFKPRRSQNSLHHFLIESLSMVIECLLSPW